MYYFTYVVTISYLGVDSPGSSYYTSLMYIVPSTKRIGDKSYTYYNLVESVRTEKGPRHRVVLSLGKLDSINEDRIRLLGKLIDQRLGGQIRLLPPEAEEQSLQEEAERIAQLVIQKNSVDRDAGEPVEVDLDGIEAGEAVLLGPVYVGEQMWKRLGLDEILRDCGFSKRQARLAMIEVVGRLVTPRSELATSGWVGRTALSDLIGEKLQYVNKDALYRISDRLWAKRNDIESGLAAAEGKLFELEETMVLYDLTSTYFEGAAELNPKAKRGYSRDHRGDCKQLVVGMVLDEAGFPKASETWQGNTHDSATLDHMLGQLESRCGKRAGTTVVMDRGIASAENVALLSERGYHYVVAVAGSSRYRWVEEIRSSEFDHVDTNHPSVEVCRRERDGQAYLLVRSEERAAKDRAIRERFSERITAELDKLAAQVTAGKVNRTKALERIGRMRQRNQRASRFFVTELSGEDEKPQLTWHIDERKLGEAEALDGVYILKTDRLDLDRHRLWSLYMMLQSVDRSFRYLKSSLGIRPIFHHLERRSDGHVFISILAYHLLHAVEQMLLAHGDHRSWPTVNDELQTHRMLTISVKDAAGRNHHIRVATRPTQTQRQIYRMLKLNEKPMPTKRYVVEPGSSDENEGSVITP
jgi:transposase